MLQGLLFILLLVFIIVAVAAMVVVRIVARGLGMFRDAARAAGEFSGGWSGNAGARMRQHGNRCSSSSSEHYRKNDGGASSRTHATASGTTIIDHRDPQAADRKIFADSDGEYVDFEETR